MRKLFAASFVAAVLTTVPAFAQDVSTTTTTTTTTEQVAPDRHDSFLGFRIEGNAGGDRFQSQNRHNDKFGYGGTIGFDGQIGTRIVVGPEASYWRADNSNENCAGFTGGVSCTRSYEEYGVGVRAGVLVAPQLLAFGKGGFVHNEQRNQLTSTVTNTSVYDRDGVDGYQVGGGLQYGIGSRFHGPLAGLYASAQYVYSRYDNHTSRQRVMGGIGIHFK